MQGLQPSRSTDLLPPNIFLWGYLKSVAYATHPHSTWDLKENIRECVREISPETLRRVLKNMMKHVNLCETQNDAQFQHLV